MSRRNVTIERKVLALRTHQWLDEWAKVDYAGKHRKMPEKSFYMFTMSGSYLKALSGIARRTTRDLRPRRYDLGIQRWHDEKRSREIREYVKYGFPWSELSEQLRKADDFNDLRMPGWLPTSVVVNVLTASDERNNRKVHPDDLVTIENNADNRTATIILPESFVSYNWKPKEEGIYPIEIIDGQHRLWAFEEEQERFVEFELPVVAFWGLDISWQAYLFWTINIKPKKINASLAFDLYPLLRTADWLEKDKSYFVYRETRAQEITEMLWSHPASPWLDWINMLGEPGLESRKVSQAAWIRSLMASYIKGRSRGLGGLFCAPVEQSNEPLPWSRAQQAAFIIYAGKKIEEAIKNCREEWAESIRKQDPEQSEKRDKAFYGRYSLINTDQGVRGILQLTNDLSYISSTRLGLEKWIMGIENDDMNEESIADALKSLREQSVSKFLERMAGYLAKYDWRASSTPGLTEEKQKAKAAFRGSGGYKEIRKELLIHLTNFSDEIGDAAKAVLERLDYEKEKKDNRA